MQSVQSKRIEVGDRLGKLTVIAFNGKHNMRACRVRCDCGTEMDVGRGNFKRGTPKSCGCDRSAPRLGGDYTGQRFGRLVVLSIKSDRGPKFWRVQCDCGKVTDVRHYALRKTNNAQTSCGCLKGETRRKLNFEREQVVKDLAGQRFGKLVVVERAGSNKRGDARWLCRCDCGNSKVVTRWHLIGGHTASCGCARLNGEVVRSDERRKQSIAYRKKRIQEDGKFALEQRVRCGIYQSLRKVGAKKNGARWEGLVGYNTDALHRRLKRTMPAGYTWDDFIAGKLHIDHIVPLAAHNYQTADDPDFRRAWALTNLQLLPAAENLAKSASLSAPFQPSFSFGA